MKTTTSSSSVKVALLTGASGGIGHAFACRLAAEGYHLVLSGRNVKQLEAVARELHGRPTTVLPADLSDPSARRELIADAQTISGRIDLVVSNAGLLHAGPVASGESDALHDLLAVNLEAPMDLARLAIPGMVDAGGGRFLFVSVIAVKWAAPNLIHYSASKAGLTNLSAGITNEYGKRGVTSTVLYPGVVRGEGMYAEMLKRPGVTHPKLFPATTPDAVARTGLRAVHDGRRQAWAALGGPLLGRLPRLGTRGAMLLGASRVFGDAAGSRGAAALHGVGA